MSIQHETPRPLAIGEAVVWTDPQTGNLMTGTCSGYIDTTGGKKPMFTPDESYGFGGASWPMEPGSWSIPQQEHTKENPKLGPVVFFALRKSGNQDIADLYDKDGNLLGEVKKADPDKHFQFQAAAAIRELAVEHGLAGFRVRANINIVLKRHFND